VSGDIQVEISLAELEALIAIERAARHVQVDGQVPSVDSTCELETALQKVDAVREASRRASGTAPPGDVVPMRRKG
jgi:hypothetical protein